MNYFLQKIEKEEIRELLSYYFELGGKRMRPTLFYVISKAFDSKENLGPFSLVLELIHTMSLYHDDVLDNAEERRGAPTVHKKWDFATAIVGGDIFHGVIHNYILQAINEGRIENDTLALKFLSELIMKVELVIGSAVITEMRLTNDRELPNLDEAIQFTRDKTAPLFAFSASAAAYLAGQNEIICEQMYEMGMKMGYAFQLLDDISDYFNSNKGFGNDLREDRKTALLILCNQADSNKLSTYREQGKSLSKEQIYEFREDFKTQFLKIVDWATTSLMDAEKLIDIIPENHYKENVSIIMQMLLMKCKEYIELLG